MTPDKSKLVYQNTAVLLLGHGSQAPHVQSVLENIAENVARYTGLTVMSASLQFSEMNITKAIELLYERGFKDLIIAPLFLFRGNHILQDIPEWLDKDHERFPDLSFVITDPIGTDLRVSEAVASRIIHACRSRNTTDAYSSFGADTSAGDASYFLSKRPESIEEESFQIIEGLIGTMRSGAEMSADLKKVLYRMIHAAGDPALVEEIIIDDAAVAAGVAAITAGLPVYCDVNMVESALSQNILSKFDIKTHVHVNDADVIANARKAGQTRAVWGVKKAHEMFGDEVIYLIGNSPTALFEILRLVNEEGHRPRFIVGTPVGFVGAREAKNALIARSDIHKISISGFKGGSPMCAAAFNGLLRVADEK